MDEATIRAIDEELRDTLRDVGLGWVVEQAEEASGEGHYEVSVRRRGLAAERQIVERASDARRGEIATHPFTPEERLDLLIQAASTALNQTGKFEDAVRSELMTKDLGVERIEFVNEDTGEAARVLPTWDDTTPPERRATQEVIDKLTTLRGRVRGDA